MAGAIYKAEFTVTEVKQQTDPHKQLSDTSNTERIPATNIAGSDMTMGAMVKKMLPKLTVAFGISTAIKTGQFIYNTINTNQANSAMIAGDTIAYKHLQNQQTVVNNSISIGSSIALGATAGFMLGGPPGAAIGAGVAALSQGVQQIMKIPEYIEQKRMYQAEGATERMINNLDRERFGTNARTYR